MLFMKVSEPMLWSFALAAGSLSGLWVVGRRPLVGWVWLAVMEVAWVVYSIITDQFGLGLLCAAYLVMYSINSFRELRAL